MEPPGPREARPEDKLRDIRQPGDRSMADTGEEVLKVAQKIRVKTITHRYPLERANEALDDLRYGRFKGAAVLSV